MRLLDKSNIPLMSILADDRMSTTVDSNGRKEQIVHVEALFNYSTISPTKSKSISTTRLESIQNQYLTAVIASISTFITGTVIGWTSQISPQILNGALGFPVTEDDLGWVASLALLGAAGMALVTGALADYFGRKRLLLLLAVPMTLGWLSILFAESVAMVYIGRIVTGMIGGANCALFAVYSNEIASDSIRGQLGSLNNLMLSIGILFDSIVGKYVSIPVFTLICTCIPVLFIAAFAFMPESPLFLIKNGREAGVALRFLRGADFDVSAEIARVQGLQGNQKVGAQSLLNSWRVLYREIRSERATRNGMVIALGLMSFRVFVGVDAITSYSSHIFTSAGMDFDPQMGTIILITIQVATGIFQSTVIDRVGRRYLLLLSAVISTLCLGTISASLAIKSRLLLGPDSDYTSMDYILLVALSVFYLGYSLGYGPVPFLMSAELFPVSTRSTAAAIGIFCTKIWAFVVSKSFIMIKSAGGQDIAFMIYTALTVIGIAFIYRRVPETKGKSSEEIVHILEKR